MHPNAHFFIYLNMGGRNELKEKKVNLSPAYAPICKKNHWRKF